MKTIISALLLTVCLLSACKKKDDVQAEIKQPDKAETFTIDGVQDIAFNPAYGSNLYLTIKHIGAVQDRVTLSVAGLPEGLTATFDHVGGTPDFETAVSFRADRSALAAGVYPVKLSGASASSTRSYDFNVSVPPFNGFTIDGARYYITGTSRLAASHKLFFIARDDAGAEVNITCMLSTLIPSTDGTYPYQLNSDLTLLNSMSVRFTKPGHTYDLFGAAGSNAKLIVLNGKISINFSEIVLSGGGRTVEVSAAVNEKLD